MMIHPFSKPQSGEYAEYYQQYIGLLPDEDILKILEDQRVETLELLGGLMDEQALFTYEEGKWSVKQVVGHIIDTERVFAYRGLCFARGDNTPLPGFEQDDYVMHADFNSRPLKTLAGEFENLRKSNICLFSTWSEAVQLRTGMASGLSVTARAIPFILAGHERHHLNILNERYLPKIRNL